MPRQRRGAWTVLGSTIRYRNPWMTVREDQVIQPDGQPGTFGVVELRPGVSVLPIADDGTVYLVRVYRYTIDRESLETIAGGLAAGEPPQAAARRELREEAGIEAEELVDLGVLDQLTEVVVSRDCLFLARGIAFATTDREENEQIRLVSMPLADAIAAVMSGAITHAASAALIFKAAIFLQQSSGKERR